MNSQVKYYYMTAREEFWVNERGEVSRPAIGMAASGAWVITGAVRLNDFGHVIERCAFPACFDIKQLHHANGKQQWFLTDIDHGTERVQMAPKLRAVGKVQS